MRDYTHYSIDVTITTKADIRHTLEGDKTVKYSADLCIEAHNTSMADILCFSDKCKAIVKALRKAIKANNDITTITIRFGRFDYRESTDSLINVRSASGFCTPNQLLENEGVYLYDEHHFSEADYWLDSKADLLEALREFADNSTYFHNDIYL